ncbi:ribbon-helix-helix domain-containing protein [Azospirillum sp. sgz302134]
MSLDLEDSALRSKKLRVPGRITSVRLEAGLWDAYDAVCRALNCTRHALASRIEARRDRAGLGLTNAIRLVLVEYWRAAADDNGADAALEKALSAISPKSSSPVQTAVLRMRDKLAPEMTPRRIKIVAKLAQQHVDPTQFAAAARSLWGPLAPWDSRSDVLAGQALQDLLVIVGDPPPTLQHMH